MIMVLYNTLQMKYQQLEVLVGALTIAKIHS